MVKVIILIGIPASGKSSFVNTLVNRYANPVNIISPDFIEIAVKPNGFNRGI